MNICDNLFVIVKICLVCILFSCTSSIKQFYPDSYFDEDNIYQNKSLGFLLTFIGNWHIITDPNNMDRANRKNAHYLKESGSELLFIGKNIEGFIGTRGIAVNLNIPSYNYAKFVQHINKKEIVNDSGLTNIFFSNYSAVKWIYEKAEIKFVEYFFNIGTYDIRIAFWTDKNLFENFIPVFEAIMESLILI